MLDEVMRERGGLEDADITDFLSSDYSRLVAGLALVLGGRAAAEDAVQEALARAWERTMRGQRIDSLRDWVAVVAMNLLRSRLRRLRAEGRATERIADLEGSRTAPTPALHRADERLDLARAMRTLPGRQREALVLHYFGGLGVAEIARAMRMKEGRPRRRCTAPGDRWPTPWARRTGKEASMPDLDEFMRREVDRMAREVDASRALSGVTRRVRRRRVVHAVRRASLAIMVVVGSGLALLGALWFFGSPGTVGAGPTKVEVASTTVGGDVRMVLIAERRSGTDSAATVEMTVWLRRDGGWRRAGRIPVGRAGSWRWNTLFGPGAVCRLSAADAPSVQVEVSLRGSTPGGCSPPFAFGLRDGKLVPK
jgi:RNA polymerase sigma factor (sigma-70 family)